MKKESLISVRSWLVFLLNTSDQLKKKDEKDIRILLAEIDEEVGYEDTEIS